MGPMLYTIGHSNHEISYFLSLLQKHGIDAVCDVRSHPYSRYVPQYSRESLIAALANVEIKYVFLGKELGARSNNPACYAEGKVQYDRLAQEPQFIEGLTRLREGMERYSIAVMCSEKDPILCHRAVLVARKIFEAGVPINHIHADGTLESHTEMESRLLSVCKLPEGDLFRSRDEFVSEAYQIQGSRIAYQNNSSDKEESAVA